MVAVSACLFGGCVWPGDADSGILHRYQRVRLLLSLDDAVMRALANSLDIRAVSYNPSIAREDMIKAAAEFDYVVFGSYLYQNDDVQTARDAWPEFNLSRFRIARVSHRQSVAAFRQAVEETITTVIAAYWELYRARRDLEIQQKLFDVTEETYKRVKAREELDATAVQIKQTEAAMESRRALIIRADRAVKDAQDVSYPLKSTGPTAS